MDRSELAIVIPALNEAASIAAIVHACEAFGTVIVVDDGSTDGTGGLAGDAGAVVVTHKTNRGYDGALNSGFERAAHLGYRFAITVDADGQHNPQIIRAFATELDQGADVVVGARDRKQRIAEHVFSLLTRAKYRVDDPLCGMKAYRMSVYRDLGHFDSYRSIGTELLLFAARRGLVVRQIPIVTRQRVGMPRFGGRLSANLKIMRAAVIAFLVPHRSPAQGNQGSL